MLEDGVETFDNFSIPTKIFRLLKCQRWHNKVQDQSQKEPWSRTTFYILHFCIHFRLLTWCTNFCCALKIGPISLFAAVQSPPCVITAVACPDYLPAAPLDNHDDMTASWQARLSRPLKDWQPIPAVILSHLTPLPFVHLSFLILCPEPCSTFSSPQPLLRLSGPWAVVSLPGCQPFWRPETKPWPHAP